MKFWLHMGKLQLRMMWSALLHWFGFGYKLAPRLVPNPLLRYPRNLPCYCKSGRKFKYCHRNILPSKCLPSFAQQADQLLKSAGVI